MKHRLAILVISSIWLLISGFVHAEPEVKLQTSYYAVQGESARALRASMNTTRPKGMAHDAYTKWHVSWSYTWHQVNGNYALQSSKVSVAITMTLPQWTPSQDADKRLVERWQRYITALRRHENGHAVIGTQAAREIEKKLQTLPAAPSTEALKELVERTCQQVLAEARAREKKFDEDTHHGIKEGARFP